MTKGHDSEDLPPPYTIADEPYRPETTAQPYLFSSHLSSLRAGIATEQAARHSAQDDADNHMLFLLIPYVEECLASIAAIYPPPSIVEATLVPHAAVDDSWLTTDNDDKRDGVVNSVVRISEHSKIPSGQKRPAASNNELWWSDEDMARRLASHLQPARPTAAVDRQTVREHVGQQKKSSRWGFLKGPYSASSSSDSQSRTATATPKTREDITMTVVADEKTFRKENDFGIWESKTGWGIVVRVKIRQK